MVIANLLQSLPSNWAAMQAVIGPKWTITTLQDPAGMVHAGLASTWAVEQLTQQASFQLGYNDLRQYSAMSIAHLALSPFLPVAAMGLAALNAMLPIPTQGFGNIDGADWLAARGMGNHVAIVGRFPFIEEELRPVAGKISVFELDPQPGEYSPDAMATIFPQADVIGITSSTFVNGTISTILPLIPSKSQAILLGASTPLTPKLFDYGVDVLAGAHVVDIDAATEAVLSGDRFSHIKGIQRVSLSATQFDQLTNRASE